MSVDYCPSCTRHSPGGAVCGECVDAEIREERRLQERLDRVRRGLPLVPEDPLEGCVLMTGSDGSSATGHDLPEEDTQQLPCSGEPQAGAEADQ
jgi:hypothetical protein